jgi:hypothetical protein
MLYDSTKGLLQSILLSLETGDESRWDDQTESGNACLYEMHQMANPLYKAYRSDRLTNKSPEQGGLPEKLNRAMPHVRTMVIAIRRKDRGRAIESGKAALAEMNGARQSITAGSCAEPEAGSQPAAAVVRNPPSTNGKHSEAAEDRAAKRFRASNGK